MSEAPVSIIQQLKDKFNKLFRASVVDIKPDVTPISLYMTNSPHNIVVTFTITNNSGQDYHIKRIGFAINENVKKYRYLATFASAEEARDFELKNGDYISIRSAVYILETLKRDINNSKILPLFPEPEESESNSLIIMGKVTTDQGISFNSQVKTVMY